MVVEISLQEGEDMLDVNLRKTLSTPWKPMYALTLADEVVYNPLYCNVQSNQVVVIVIVVGCLS